MAAILFGWIGLSEPLWYCITKLSTNIVDLLAGLHRMRGGDAEKLIN